MGFLIISVIYGLGGKGMFLYICSWKEVMFVIWVCNWVGFVLGLDCSL